MRSSLFPPEDVLKFSLNSPYTFSNVSALKLLLIMNATLGRKIPKLRIDNAKVFIMLPKPIAD